MAESGVTASRSRRAGRRPTGSIRREGEDFVLRHRGRKLVLGTVADLRTRGVARLEADRRLVMAGGVQWLSGRRARASDYVDAYVASRVSILKPSSKGAFRTYAGHLKREFRDRWLDEIDLGVAQQFVATLAGRGLSRATVYAIASFLRRVLKAARAEGIAAVAIGPRELAFPKDARSVSMDLRHICSRV